MTPAARPLKLLLIEDDEPTARALRVLFHRRAGVEVIWASSLADGRAMLDESPDAVLLDLMLPDGDGETLLEEIREREGPGPRVVVVTALPEGSRRLVKVAKLAPHAIVHKPYEVELLMAAVKGDPDPQPQATEPPK